MINLLQELAVSLQVLSITLAAMPPGTIPPKPPLHEPVEPKTSITTTLAQKEPILQNSPPNPPFYMPDKPTQGQIRSLIAYYAKEAGVSQVLAIFLAEKESRFNSLAVNPITGAGGLFQWLKSSWFSFCDGDRFSTEDNAWCAVKTLSEPNGIRHWSSDLNMRRLLINEGFIECFEGKNNCYLL